MSGHSRRSWLCASACMCVAVVSAAQSPLPATTTATFDTLEVRLQGWEDQDAPLLHIQLPDTLRFGGTVRLEVGPLDHTVDTTIELSVDDPCAEIAAITPQADSSTLAIDLRLYWVGPVRIGWHGTPVSLTPVFFVQGRLAGAGEPAPVRAPHRPRRTYWLLAASVALLLLLLGAGGYGLAKLRNRLRRRDGRWHLMADHVSDPAWMDFVQSAEQLSSERFSRPGGVGEDLGRLTLALQDYLRRRFTILTSGIPTSEVCAAFVDRQYEASLGDGFAGVLARLEEARFRPEAPTSAEAREIFCEVLALVETTLGARTTDGAAARVQLSVDSAWRRLRERTAAWSSSATEEVTGEI